MKKILVFIVCFSFVQCGSSNKVVNKAGILLNCLTKDDVLLLNEGVLHFENHLKEVYGSSQFSELEIYKKYLNNLTTMSFNRSFFQSKESRKFLVKLKKTEAFKTLYKMYEEPKYDDIEFTVPITDRDQTEKKDEVLDFYVFNEAGDFSTCLIKKSTVKDVKSYFETLKNVPDISPTIKAGALLELFKTLKQDISLVKLSIVFDLYYGSFLMLNREEI